MAKVFNTMPKWRNFAKSGHTEAESHLYLIGSPHLPSEKIPLEKSVKLTTG